MPSSSLNQISGGEGASEDNNNATKYSSSETKQAVPASPTVDHSITRFIVKQLYKCRAAS